jgi:E1A/CREB-binding protein
MNNLTPVSTSVSAASTLQGILQQQQPNTPQPQPISTTSTPPPRPQSVPTTPNSNQPQQTTIGQKGSQLDQNSFIKAEPLDEFINVPPASTPSSVSVPSVPSMSGVKHEPHMTADKAISNSSNSNSNLNSIADVKKEENMSSLDEIKKELSSPPSPTPSSNSNNNETNNDVKPDIKPSISSGPATPTTTSTALTKREARTPQRKVFKPDELRQALMPTLEKLYRQDPESLPFRQPVDPTLLQIPDYFDIVKKPMDLSTIKKKLDTGQYTDPWQYADDVWLMFSNAWLYNRKTSRVYRYCSKVS